MDFSQSEIILNDLQVISKQDETLNELYEDIISRCINYAQIRVKWFKSDLDQRKEIDRLRSGNHDALIDSFNILSRVYVFRQFGHL